MGNEFRVNSYQSNWQRDSNVTALRDGGFVVTWSSYFNEYDDSDIETTYIAAQFYDAGGKRIGGEKIVRAVNDSNSEKPQATQLKNGNVVLTWSEAIGEDSTGAILANGHRIKAQVVDTKGNAVSKVVTVDTVKSAEAVLPDIVALDDGGFAVSFGVETSSSTFDDAYVRAFSSTGVARGENRKLNTSVNKFDEFSTKSAALSNGNSVVVWNAEAAIKDGADDSQNQIRATILDESGKAVRSDFGLTPQIGGAGGLYTGYEDHTYSVAGRAGGGFAVVSMDWTRNPDDDGRQALYFSGYDASGKASGSRSAFFEQGTVIGDVEMAQLSTGHYVVVWSQQSLREEDVGDDAYAMILSASGKAVSSVFEVGVDADKYDDQEELSVAALAGGGFVVSYNSDSIDSDDEGIAARIYGRGTGGSDTLKVDTSGLLSGLGGNDKLTGDTRANQIDGGDGNDTLYGGSGNDRLSGGFGNDRLRGDSGADTFIFNNSLSTKSNVDAVADFSHKDDTFELDDGKFAGLEEGRLDDYRFKEIASASSTKGVDSSDRILYDKDDGDLYFDRDGSGGKYDRVQFARVSDDRSLDHTDFLIV